MFRSETNDIYIQCHDITLKVRKFSFGPGYPVQESTLIGFYQAINPKLMKTYKSKELIPSNVLYVSNEFGSECIVWYILPCEKYLSLSKATQIRSGNIRLPGIIFKYQNGKLFIFCFKGKKIPNIDTPIYHNPFYNVYAGGDVCLGSAEIKTENKDIDTIIRGCENAFFGSTFTHSSSGTEVKDGKSRTVWRHAMKIGLFHSELLVKSKKTLKEIIE